MGWDFSAVTGTIATVELQTQHFVFQFAPFGDDAAGDQIFGQIATPAASFGTASFTDLYRITSDNPDNNPHNPPTTFNALGSDSLLDITSTVGQAWLNNPELLEVKLGYQRDSDSTIPSRHLQVFRDDTGTGDDAFVLRVTMAPEPPTITVPFDIKPGSDSNPINLKSKGVLPAAILSTEDFSVTDINVTTLLFGDPLLLDDNGTAVSPLRYAYEDVSDDGLLDLTLKFSMPDLVDYGALGPLTTEGLLTGELFDGTQIMGTDTIRIVPGQGGPPAPVLFAVTAIPEPSALTLAACALLGLAGCGRRKRLASEAR